MKTLLRAVLLRFIPVILPLLLLTACGSDGDSVSRVAQGGECFSNEGKAEVLNIMEDWYLWNDEADQFNKYRNLDLDDFDDAADLLSFLRYLPGQYDRGFSYITTPEEEEAFFGEGEFIGFGFGMLLVDNEIRLSQVYAGSPADVVGGFQRGFRLMAINGRTIDQIMANEGLTAALGPSRIGFSATFDVEDVDGDPQPPVSLSKAIVTIDPVPVVDVLGSGDDIGYILFNTFISSANIQLRDAFALFATENVDKVVVDLRYNGGGLVSVSDVLAGLLIGPGHESDIYTTYRFNSDRAPDSNISSFFQPESDALTLDKIVFITSSGSASASELVINGLEPYFPNPGDFALIGVATYGKPVGQFAFDFCDADYRLRAVTFQSVNVNGEGEYFDGLPVDCPAEDDLSLALGDPAEASLAEAVSYLENGDCPLSFAPGFGISRAGSSPVKARPVFGPTLAQQYAGAF
jgi:carboxyl-terminal processing protease